MIAIVLALALGQVNLCGTGKSCSVYTLSAMKSTASTCAVSIPSASVRMCMGTATNAWLSYNGGSNVLDIETSTGGFRFLTGGVQSGSSVGAGQFTASSGYNASVAYASFPAAAAGNTGRWLFDSTNVVWRYSNGSAWVKMPPAVWQFGGGIQDASIVKGSAIVTAQARAPIAATATSLEVVTLLAGTGAGTFDVVVYNVTTATTLCSVTGKACTNAAQTTDTTYGCTGVVNASDVLQIRVDNDGCDSSPFFNAIATLNGGT